jgi:hypothetical protein
MMLSGFERVRRNDRGVKSFVADLNGAKFLEV